MNQRFPAAVQLANPKIPEGINTSDEHPLREFAWLLGGVIGLALLIVVVLTLLAQTLTRYIPFEYEVALLSRFESTQPTTSPIQTYLQSLADRIAEAQELPEDMVITVHYVDTDEVNAFATLGGHIVIFRGLLEKMPSENALAMVIAHEIAHIKHRDPIVALGRAVTIGVALAALAGVASDSAARIIGNTGIMTSLTFNRGQERAADDVALASLVATYGHAGDAGALFEILRTDENGVVVPEFMLTHPHTQSRIARIDDAIADNGWQIGEVDPMPQHLLLPLE